MKISQKELKKLIQEAIQEKLLNKKKTEKNDKEEISEDWVKFLTDVDSFVTKTVTDAKELMATAEKLQEKQRDKDSVASFTKPRSAYEYKVVNDRKSFIKNLITKLSMVNFDTSEAFYKGKV